MSELLVAAALGPNDIAFVVEFAGPGEDLLIAAARAGKTLPVNMEVFDSDGERLPVPDYERMRAEDSQDLILRQFTEFIVTKFGSWNEMPDNLTLSSLDLDQVRIHLSS